MKRTTALLALLLLAALPAQARDIKVAGMGVRTCADWMQWKEARNGEARAMAVEWTRGFISGHNVYASSGDPVVADVKVLMPLLDAYCEKNRDSRVFGGAIEIIRNLGGAKVNVTPKVPAPAERPAPSAPEKSERES